MENFFSTYDQGFVRVAACSVPVSLGQPAVNAEAIADSLAHCSADGVGLAVFPELSLTGYSIGDLLLQETLLEAAEKALISLAKQTEKLLPVAVVGLPVRRDGHVYNAAAVLHRGEILGIVPKQYVPEHEARYFSPAPENTIDDTITIGSVPVLFGNYINFHSIDVPGLRLHVELGEDMAAPISPGTHGALAGATIIATLAASPAAAGRANERLAASSAYSKKNTAAHIYVTAGEGESSTDFSWDGHAMIHELGEELASLEPFASSPQVTTADVDLRKIEAERRRSPKTTPIKETIFTGFELNPPLEDIGFQRKVARFPYVSDDDEQLAADCEDVFNIQVYALAQRLKAIGHPKILLGVSGGLDSTQALLVAAKTMDMLKRPRTDILAFTMPGFATTDHTKNNAKAISESLGVTFDEIDIKPVAKQMLTDMGHPFGRGEEVYDVTFENVQAGLRTDYLFRLANDRGGIVLGTGDLSELALGWATYGVGDQMSHYNVNPGLPKTLMQQMIRWVIASEQFDTGVLEVLQSIVDTEITPELIPTREGEVAQSTQASIGPYALQDFNLYYLTRYGMQPSRIAFLSYHAWHDQDFGDWPAGYPVAERGAYSLGEIKKWLELFLRRFFNNQFKRSAAPNGPQVHEAGSLSPRGGWNMPADISSPAWIAELNNVPDEA